MSKCPFCQADLGDTPLSSSNCPACGRELTSEQRDPQQQPGRETIDEGAPAGSPDDTRHTIDEGAIEADAGRQTVDEGAVEPAPGMQTVDESDSVDEIQRATDTVDEATLAEAFGEAAGEGRQTVDESQLPPAQGDERQTIDESVGGAPGEGASDDGMQTVDEGVRTDARGEEASNVAVDSAAAEGEARDTVDDGDVSRTIEVTPPMAGGTVDDKIEKTIDSSVAPPAGAQPPAEESKGEGPESGKDKGTGTVDERSIAQTIDVGELPEGLPPDKGTGTVDERHIARTIDSEAPLPLTGEKTPDEGTVTERAVSATLDSNEIPEDVAVHIQATWQGTLGAGVTSMTSIKREFAAQAAEGSTLVIHPRRFSERAKKAARSGADYDILKLLGEGGMGMVYAARQASIDRTVAVKTLKPDTSKDRQQRDKFLSEAVVTGDLEHPNIVPVYDVGMRDDGSLFYSMKRVQGTPWMDVIQEKSLHENLEILMKVADAMAFAHDKKVVHRDLKPENVMLAGYGEVLVMDWGLAVPSDGRRIGGIVQSLSMGGTPAYMAPEMAAGPFEKIGFCSDIYLLGAILYEIVTGTPPHSGADVMKCLFAAARNEIQPTNKSGELIDIALKAMAARPEDRYATVADFQNAVREYLSHSESVALSTRAAEDLEQAAESDDYQDFAKALFGFEEAYELWSGNKRARQGMSDAALAYAGSAKRKGDFDLGVSLLKADDPNHSDLLVNLKESIKERDTRQRRLKTARRGIIGLCAVVFLTVCTAMAAVYSQWQEAEVARADALTQKGKADEAKEAALIEKEAADKAKEEALQRKAEAEAAQKKAEEQSELAEMRRIAAVEARMDAEKAETEAQTERDNAQLAQKNAEEERDRAEYEGYVAQIGLVAAQIEENAFDVAVERLKTCQPELRDWEWGRLMYLCEQSVHDEAAPAQIDALAVSPDGSRIVAGGWNGSVTVWKLATDDEGNPDPSGDMTPEFQLSGLGGTSIVNSVAISPNGTLIATGGNDPAGYLRLWDAQTGEEMKNRFPNGGEGHTGTVTSVEFSGDGKWLLTSSYDGTAKLWSVEDLEDVRLLNTYRGHRLWVWDASFSPTLYNEKGESLGPQYVVTASQDGTALVWKTRWSMQDEQLNRHVTPPFMGHRGPIYSAAFSHDGERVVTAGHDKRVLVWRPDEVRPFEYEKAARGEPVEPPKFAAFDGHTAAVRTVRFSEDDKLIVSGGNDNTVRVWNVAAGRLYKTLRGHGGWVRAAEFTAGGDWIVSGGHDQKVKLWNVKGYSESKVLRSRALEGHLDSILAARFSHDGEQIVTASRDRSAKIWKFKTGDTEHDLVEGHAYLASNAAYFPDGKHIATAAIDNTARIWDVATGTELMKFEGTGRNAALAVSPNGRWILTGGDDKTAKMWDTTGRFEALPVGAAGERAVDSGSIEPRAVLRGLGGVITAVAVSPDGRWAATGESGGTCIVWDLLPLLEAEDDAEAAAPKRHYVFKQHTSAIVSLAFDGDDRLFSAGGKTVYCWDPNDGSFDWRDNLRHSDTITSMAVSPGGNTLFTACRDGGVRRWNVLHASQMQMLMHQMVTEKPAVDNGENVDGGDEYGKSVEAPLFVNSIVLSPDGRRLLTIAANDRTVRLWDTATGQEISVGDGAAGAPLLDFNRLGGVVWTATFSNGGDQLLTVGGRSARLWDIDLQLPDGIRHDRMTFSPNGVIASASFSSDGKWVVTSSQDNSARIWNAETGTDLLKLTGGHDRQVNTAVFSHDGERVLTSSDDGTAKLWKIDWEKWNEAEGKRSGDRDSEFVQVVTVFKGHDDAVNHAVFSPDESMVLTASTDKSARIWDAASGDLLGVLPAGKADGADAVDPDKSGHVWAVLSAVFSADGKQILTGSADNTAKIWDVEDLAHPEVEYTLRGHTASVTSVAFSPKGGSRLLTGSEDYTAKLWDSKGKEILTLKGHDQEVTSVAFSDDGLYALTGSRDGTAIVWLATSEGWEQNKAEADEEPEPEIKAADAGETDGDQTVAAQRDVNQGPTAALQKAS